MFPIPSGRELSFIEIANYWSREIRPSASPQELRMAMSKAWWRGELTAAKGPSRPKLLQAVYLHCANNIAFAVPGVTDPPHSRLLNDGSVEVLRLVRLPLPNADPDTWTDTNCAEAFEAIAEAWDEKLFGLISPSVAGIVLAHDEFFRWIAEQKYQPPTFWAKSSEDDDEQQPTDNTVPRITVAETQPKAPKTSAAWHAIKKRWPEGPPTNLSTADIHQRVNKWIEKQPRSVYPFEKVSRETIARLLHRK
jgi:hypothetical protein